MSIFRKKARIGAIDMKLKLVLLLFLHSLPVFFSEGNANVTIIIQGSATVAETDDNFICATIDWWPPEKCNYKQCPWGKTSVLNLDLTHPYLFKAIKGNELSGHGIGASVTSQQYARDLIAFKALLGALYRNSNSKPLLVAPGGFFNDPQWYAHLLESSGPNVLNALTHHIYNLGEGDDPHIEDKITNPNYLSRFADTFKEVQLTIQRHGPWASAWVGEAGGAYNSGSRLVSNTFLNSFWYLDQLGMASKYNTKVYCRQTLIGGNYGLLDTQTFIPNPDYYSALLWDQLMRKGVLSVDISGSPYIKAYAYCRKAKSGVSLLLINFSKSATFQVTVRNDLNVDLVKGDVRKDNSFMRGLKRMVSWIGRKGLSDGSLRKEEYHLIGKDGDYQSRTMVLNGNPLQLTEDGDIPELRPVLVAVDAPVSISPMSIVFVVFPNFEAHACVPCNDAQI